ncbi:hypothetical protein MXMO3_00147 [Maritalea myrionectae]|uniref:Uncharacterized protein n=1 Tax=Maritalea myrionectae TaxID=454601 RepID=A0A2R4M9R1_9HYPH|nr:hypothetical protein [Maritalea myrionectae]AVX02695.1 hypothetical protein MXMO3_00147 [Maritalea myrionectae]
MKNLLKRCAVIGALGAGLLAGSAFAQSGAGGLFTLHNITESNIVVGFYTNDGSGWSTNWLSEEMNPGETAQAEFFATTGSCDQTFQVGWLGADDGEVLDDPISIDICDASEVYLADNEIYFE